MIIINIFKGKFGLERETLRVDKYGRLSQTPHPFNEKYFVRDFAENQLELVTPACNSIEDLMLTLEKLDLKAKKILADNQEYLWLCSNPPYFESEEEIPVANYTGSQAYRTEYRNKLVEKYGKRLMLYCGIHFNFSFDENYLHNICIGDYFSFKNSFYLRLAKQVSRYSYIIVLLTSASPVYDLSLEEKQGSGFDGYASRRNGHKGYWNTFVPVLDFTDLNSYQKSVDRYISSGQLLSESELYIPVRLKPVSERGEIYTLEERGINHIELRMLDVNPLSPHGVMEEDLRFIHCFMIYLMSLEDFKYTEELQKQAFENHKNAALFDVDEKLTESALNILNDMKEYFSQYEHILKIIDFQIDKIKNNNRYCVKIRDLYGMDFHRKMTESATRKEIQQ